MKLFSIFCLSIFIITQLNKQNKAQHSYQKTNSNFIILHKYSKAYLARDTENNKILLTNVTSTFARGDRINATYYLKPKLCLSKLDNCLAMGKVINYEYIESKKHGNILREFIITHIKKYSNNPLAPALLAGYKNDLTKDIKSSFFKTGTSHLLAISGLHIGGIAMFSYFLSKKILSLSIFLMLKYDIRKISAFFSLLCALLFLIISGFPISAQRAFLFVMIYVIGTLHDFKPAITNIILTSALFLLLIEPNNLFKAGFQMSFAAALCLSIYFNSFSAHSYFKKLCYSSFIATIITTPLVIFHFGIASIIAPLVNIMVMPITSIIIMPAAFICLLLSFFGLANLSFKLLDYILQLFSDLIKYFSEFAILTPANIKINEYSLLLLLIALLIILLSGNKRAYCVALIFYLTAYIIPYFNYYKADLIVTSINKIFILKYKNSHLISERNLNIYQQKYLDKKFNKLQKFNLKDYNNSELNCNKQYCVISKNNKLVTIVNYALANDKFLQLCEKSDLVINYTSGKICPNKLTFNKYDLNKLGHIKIHLEKNNIKFTL